MSITINGTTNTITAASGVTIAGVTSVSDTTDATSTTAASLKTAGGLGVAKKLLVGTNIGLGTSTPDAGLHVNSTVTGSGLATPIAIFSGGAFNSGTNYGIGFHFSDVGSEACPVGIGYVLESTAADTKGSLGIYSRSSTVLGTAPTLRVSVTSDGHLTPGADNTYNLGSASFGWKELFCDNGTINTSDARRKTEVSTLSAAEINAAKQLAKEIGSFKFLAAVAEKSDAARLHIGMTVQRAIEIMEANGLNPFAYSFICHDAWDQQVVDHPAVEAKDAVLDDKGNVIEPAVEAKDAWTEVTLEAGDKYSFRVHELLLFMAAGFEARLSALEAA